MATVCPVLPGSGESGAILAAAEKFTSPVRRERADPSYLMHRAHNPGYNGRIFNEESLP